VEKGGKMEEMTDHKEIPDIVVGRLPMYLRTLQRMARDGRQVTSSQEMGEKLGISAAQIRKDLSQFGEFGKQGTGYNIEFLVEKLRQILHVDRDWELAVVGAGDIGSAVARYKGFANRGFKVAIVFDNDPEKVGSMVGDFAVQDDSRMIEAIQKGGIQVAMISVPAAHAQEVADQLVKAGVKAILNYAPISLNVPPGVHVQYIDPAIHLQRMTFYL
jgi:redox-sensing transcriptional repressor